jgi:hypothetical protein
MKAHDTGGVSAPATVREGGSFTITVTSGAGSVSVGIPGHGTTEVPVADGKAEFTVPAGVKPGTVILVSDDQFPEPSCASVTVVGED